MIMFSFRKNYSGSSSTLGRLELGKDKAESLVKKFLVRLRKMTVVRIMTVVVIKR